MMAVTLYKAKGSNRRKPLKRTIAHNYQMLPVYSQNGLKFSQKRLLSHRITTTQLELTMKTSSIRLKFCSSYHLNCTNDRWDYPPEHRQIVRRSCDHTENIHHIQLKKAWPRLSWSHTASLHHNCELLRLPSSHACNMPCPLFCNATHPMKTAPSLTPACWRLHKPANEYTGLWNELDNPRAELLCFYFTYFSPSLRDVPTFIVDPQAFWNVGVIASIPSISSPFISSAQ